MFLLPISLLLLPLFIYLSICFGDTHICTNLVYIGNIHCFHLRMIWLPRLHKKDKNSVCVSISDLDGTEQ